MKFKNWNCSMKLTKKLILLSLLSSSLTSCLISDYASTLQVEIMKPAIIDIPKEVKTIAIIDRSNQSIDALKIIDIDETKNSNSTTIKDPGISGIALDALSKFLTDNKYFANVINYKTSLDSIWNSSNEPSTSVLFERTKSDMCILLEEFHLNHMAINIGDYSVLNDAHLVWSILLKSDSTYYTYNQRDTLIYTIEQFPQYFNGKNGLTKMSINSSEYLGNFLGSRIIPSWLSVERLYYQSKNQHMLMAEKYAKDNNWLKAAEVWRKENTNKNTKIAAKACYNMALACEMEGRIDLAIDWLVKSYNALSLNNEEHRSNCQRYINVLVLRKKEIEKLDKQVRS